MQENSTAGPNPSGLCMCGCGAKTSLATQDDPRNGINKGQHRRYLKSHHLVGVPRSAETLRKLSEAHKGKRMGVESSRWKGGLQMRNGRLNRLVGSGHPMATASGYVLEYRLVMAEKLGRFLDVREHVHHIDMDHTNNDPDNLALVTASQHMRVHRLIDRKGMDPVEALELVLRDYPA
jgi:HNH endonuclease